MWQAKASYRKVAEQLFPRSFPPAIQPSSEVVQKLVKRFTTLAEELLQELSFGPTLAMSGRREPGFGQFGPNFPETKSRSRSTQIGGSGAPSCKTWRQVTTSGRHWSLFCKDWRKHAPIWPNIAEFGPSSAPGALLRRLANNFWATSGQLRNSPGSLWATLWNTWRATFRQLLLQCKGTGKGLGIAQMRVYPTHAQQIGFGPAGQIGNTEAPTGPRRRLPTAA